MIILLTIYLTGLIIINWVCWIIFSQFASDLYEASLISLISIVWPILLPMLTIIIIFKWIKCSTEYNDY